MDQKCENINSQLINIKYNLTKNREDIVNNSLPKVKDSIIEGLRGRKFEASAKSRIKRADSLNLKQIPISRISITEGTI